MILGSKHCLCSQQLLIGFFLLLASVKGNASGEDAATIIADSVKIKQTETQAVLDKREKATGELRDELQLRSGTVELLRFLGDTTSARRQEEIRSLKLRIAILEAADEMTGKDQTEIDVRVGDEQVKIETLNEQIEEAEKPYHDGMRGLIDQYSEESKQLADALRPYFQTKPEKPFADFERGTCYGVYAQAVVNCAYLIDGKPACQLAIYFDQKGYDGERVGSINMQHDILQLSDSHAVIRTNGWTIHMYTHPNYDWNADKIKEGVATLI